jgi:hypothetical protein
MPSPFGVDFSDQASIGAGVHVIRAYFLISVIHVYQW